MKEEKTFQTQSRELLDLMINSIYSNREIFLRELLSNASDAIDKYRYLSLTDAEHYPVKGHHIRLIPDEKARTLVIEDDGIGMGLEDLDDDLGTIAKSGSKEFLEKYQEAKEKEDLSIIGQFGVGFYSLFMVGKKVEVLTRKMGDKAYLFTSEGKDTYTIEDADYDTISGTRITIYLKDDTDDVKYGEYTNTYTIERLVKKYSDYIRYPIRMEVKVSKPDLDKDGKEIEGKYHDEVDDKILNSMIPLWKKSVNDVTEEDLNKFYKEHYGDYEDPLFALNVHVDGLYSYQSLLYIPAHAPYDLYSEAYEKGLDLYSRGIFIQEKCKDLIPSHLRFVKGLVDSDDFPLNVSREMLQKTPEMAKIAKNIESKIIAELKKAKNNDRDKYNKFYDVFGEFLKYGIYSSYGMKKDELQDLLLFHHLNGEDLISLKEYVDACKENQEAIYFASGKSLAEIKLLPQLERKKKEGIDVLLLDKNIDEFCLMSMHDYEKKEFKDVSSEEALAKDEEKEKIEKLSTDHKRLLDDLKEGLGDKVDEVVVSSKLVDSPVCLSTKEGLSMNAERVLKEEPGDFADSVKSRKVLELNPDHPLFEALTALEGSDDVKEYAAILYDEAMLLQGYDIEDKAGFVAGLNKLLIGAAKK